MTAAVDIGPFLNPQTGFLAFAVTGLIYLAWAVRGQYEARIKQAGDSALAALASEHTRAEEWKEQALLAARINEGNALALADNTKTLDHAVEKIANLGVLLAERRQVTPPPGRARTERRGKAPT